MRKIAILLCALLLLVPAVFAEEAGSGTAAQDPAAIDYAAQLAEKDETIARLEAKLSALQADYDELRDTYEALLAQTAYSTLSKGSKSEEVTKLQDRLIALGYLEGNSDGNYGKNTEAAVQRFQKMVGLNADGIADGRTQIALFASDAPKATASQAAVEFNPADYEEYDYATHMASPEAYNARKVTFIGTVLQALESDGTAIFRIATSGEKDNVVYATYRFSEGEELIYKGDNVTVYAVTNGTKTYTTTTGSSKTLPACEINLIQKRG
ncbi:MAG: peptidoglycan-binding domain-containing protein [Christensenellales bacterium]|jgi:peptidoglycan hydrolase-like protein with peptidoglycan-binding domain